MGLILVFFPISSVHLPISLFFTPRGLTFSPQNSQKLHLSTMAMAGLYSEMRLRYRLWPTGWMCPGIPRFFGRQEGGTTRPESSRLGSLLLFPLFLLLVASSQLVHSQSSRIFSRAVCPGGFPLDGDDLCSFWAAIGECPRNPRFMSVKCIASCNTCPSQQPDGRQATAQSFPAQSQIARAQQQQSFSSQTSTDCSLLRVQTVEIATRIVPTRDEFENRGFRIGCLGLNQENICGQNICFHQRYRTFDGSCNNLQSSLKGAAFMPYARLQPANYEDGVARMVGKTRLMPNPRAVTHLLLSSSFVLLTKFNGLLMQFGQFLSHDITRNTVTNFCRCETVHEECANMPVPMHDTRLRKTAKQPNFCIPLTRSSVLCGTGTGRQGPGRTPRTPVNENSAWIDASQVYGSESVSARQMRVGALLRTLPLQNPPFSAVPPPEPSDRTNLITGDNRGNLFVGLMALHTVFVRLHNRIATNLMQLNPQWDQERVYQEARKVNAAILQMITYQEFLPSLLGTRLVRHMPPYTGYKPETEPAIAVEFAAGAYRLHGLIREFYQLADPNFRKIGDVRFVSNAGSVDLILRTGTDQLIRGLMVIPSKKPQRLAPAVTEELFDISDMGSLNIQRGRDQGLRPYNVYRPLCGLKALSSFEDWPEVNEPEAKSRVAALYASVDDIDLYVGGLMEAPVEDSLLGPTFSCIIAEQFRRLRDADRHFPLNPGVFTPAQVASIQRVSFAFCICATGEDFRRINPSAFLVENGSTAIPCSSIPQLDLSPWQERPSQG